MSSKHEKTALEKEFELERLILFSDAVFAIAITLLVIDIKFPEVHEGESRTLGKLLRPTLFEFAAFAFSFFVIGRSWSEHLKICRHLKKYDQGLINRNLLFLFFIVIFPFAASGISGHVHSGFYFPIYFYMGNLTLLGICQYILCRYVFYEKPHLTNDGEEAEKKYLYIKTKYAALMQVVITLLVSLSIVFFADKGNFLLFLFIPIPLIGIYMRRKIRKYKPATIVASLLLCGSLASQAQSTADTASKAQALTDLQSHYDEYKKIALQIWDFAEVGYKEVKSSALLQKTLSAGGFTVKAGVAEIPTAFVAEYGSGKPVIGILAEFDALPGLAQQAIPEKAGIEGKNAGHGCGHHLFGTASVAAGLEIKKWIEAKKLSGTIRVYGCPAEEGGSGKVYMVRAGLFNDVDVVIHWHPGSDNAVTLMSALANKSAKFRFHGLAAHAAASPDRGRSALDGVETMDYMVNMMREHIPQETRIHYVITNGGKAPNVVPDFAEVYYYVRHPKKDEVVRIFDWVAKAAEGAAMGTETKVDYEVIGGTHDLLLNRTLAEDMQRNLERVGGVSYTAAETEFAKKIQSSFTYKVSGIGSAAVVQPLKEEKDGAASTDVGDVSYTVPTVGLQAATWVPGTPAHSWQATACGGTEIGTKGMMVAAKTMVLTAIDLYTNPVLIKKAKEEFVKEKGDYQYKALLGDRKPALNYRD